MRWRKDTAPNRNEASQSTLLKRRGQGKKKMRKKNRKLKDIQSLSLFPLIPSLHTYVFLFFNLSEKKALTVCCVLGTPQGSEDLFLQWCVGKPSFLGSCGSGSPPGNKTPVPRGQSEECHDLKLRSRQLFDCRQQILMRR